MSGTSKPSTRTELLVFADYNSFELRDADAEDDPAAIDDTVAALLADLIASVVPGIVSIGTARRVKVPVTIDVATTAPPDDLAGWDHVAEASLALPSGTLVIRGGSEAPETAPRLSLPADTYRVRVYSEGFTTISTNGLEGDDAYHVVLWPALTSEPAVLKRFDGPTPGG